MFKLACNFFEPINSNTLPYPENFWQKINKLNIDNSATLTADISYFNI